MTGGRLVLILGAAAAASYLVLIAWAGPRLIAAAAGLQPFDLRLAGYSVEDATTYLDALTPQGRAFYLGPVRLVDTVFPMLFTGFLVALMLWLSPRATALTRAALAALALGYLVFDLAENAAVAGLLRSGAVDPEAVIAASRLTVIKFAFVGASLVAILALFIRRRRQGP